LHIFAPPVDRRQPVGKCEVNDRRRAA
jgi:hypothetical protein